jgi:hypothetical protein
MSNHRQAIHDYLRRKHRAPNRHAPATCFLCGGAPANCTADLYDCRGRVRRVALCDRCFELPYREFVRRCMRRLGR